MCQREKARDPGRDAKIVGFATVALYRAPLKCTAPWPDRS